MPNEALSPDSVEGQLAGGYFSVFLMNAAQGDLSDIKYTVTISNHQKATELSFQHALRASLVPGKATELNIDVSQYELGQMEASWEANDVAVTVYQDLSQTTITHKFVINRRKDKVPYRFTFLDRDGTVHFCAVVPPKEMCPPSGCPVVFGTHGADVVADKSAWVYAYKQQKAAYIVLPTNRHKYGFSWETVGYVNGKEALKYFGEHLPGVPISNRANLKADTTRRLYTGHSMGGHGCLVYSTHEPDYALASVPMSGWIRHELYLPKYMQYDLGYSDHFLRSLLFGAVQEYATDMYAPNLKGIPTLLRYGSADDVVPPYMLRRIGRILNEIEGRADAVQISEVKGEGHWWDDVCYDPTINNFFHKHLGETDNLTAPLPRPPLPKEFTLVLTNPSNMKGKGGIKVLQQIRTQQLSQVKVTRETSAKWNLETQNVRRFGFYRLDGLAFPSEGILIDGQQFSGPPKELPVHFCKLGLEWEVCNDEEWEQNERSPATYGPAKKVSKMNC
jgi:hypothetical protein